LIAALLLQYNGLLISILSGRRILNPLLFFSGYFYFEECGNITNPIIGLELGETYTFDQSDISNYYHPLGFAYFPDGDHVGMKELEPAVTEGTSDCAASVTCPAPMYFRGDTYLGSYSNIPEVKNNTEDEYDFGLDKYEPVFAYPLTEWAGHKPFSVKLRFDDDTYGLDLFYFCHVSIAQWWALDTEKLQLCRRSTLTS